MHHSAIPRYSEHQHPFKKGKNVVHLTQDVLETGSDSEQTEVGLVTCHVLNYQLWNLMKEIAGLLIQVQPVIFEINKHYKIP